MQEHLESLLAVVVRSKMSFKSNYWEQKRACHAFVEDAQLMGQVHVCTAFKMNGFLHISKHVVCGICEYWIHM